MRISKVIVTNSQSSEKQTFTFGTASQGKEAVTSKGGHLHSYLEFCFNEESVNQNDVETFFVLNKDEFSLARLHNDDGSTRRVLKRVVDGRWQVVARDQNVIPYIEAITKVKLSELVGINYINNNAIANFGGRLDTFAEIKFFTDVRDEIVRSSADVRAQNTQVIKRVHELAKSTGATVTADSINAITAEMEKVSHALASATAKLAELRAKNSTGAMQVGVATKLESAKQKYQQLLAQEDEMEKSRSLVKLYDEIKLILLKIKEMELLAEQRTENEQKRETISKELEWQEGELTSVQKQLEEKRRQFAATQDKRNRVDAINSELTYISGLYEENKQLNELLLELNEKKEHLTSERVLYNNKLDNVEKSLSDAKDNLDAFHIPARSVGELLETVRVDVKIDEVNAQIEKLQSEINIKESQIAEKESQLVVQMKRFRSVAELDVAVSPMKAKDTILQVLDSKYSKLEAINISLEEKRRNLERALEDYKYRILQLETSRSKLEAERRKALLRKQEEFKRDVFLTSQKVYGDDPTSVFAVTSRLEDEEIDAIEAEIAARNSEHDMLVERAAQLAGSIKEITRHIEINAAEMETLNREKQNINSRYNEIVSQNSSEAVFNYLKALNSDNGTKYLLDVQQDAVRSETELTELKRSVEALRAKLSALKARLRYLEETQSQLDNVQMSVDHLVATNDRMKDDLTDIGERLSAGYEQYAAICRQLEAINSKLDDINAAIVETQKTIKVNASQIAQATERAKKQAGGDDLEKALASFKYEMGDVESEIAMLEESLKNLEKEIFKKRLELEKVQWLYESNSREYDAMYQDVQLKLQARGLDLEKVSSMGFDEVKMEQLRKKVEQYDLAKSSLADTLENYNEILLDDAAPEAMPDIEAQKQEVDRLTQRQRELEQELHQTMQDYVAANTAKMKAAAAAAEAKTYAALRQTVNNTEIVGLLITDKIKATLAVATQHLNVLMGGSVPCVLMEDNGSVIANIDGDKKSFEELSDEMRAAIYISIVLALPSKDATAGKWLVFEERIAVDKASLSEMLLKFDNISYVIAYERDAGNGSVTLEEGATAKAPAKRAVAKPAEAATKPATTAKAPEAKATKSAAATKAEPAVEAESDTKSTKTSKSAAKSEPTIILAAPKATRTKSIATKSDAPDNTKKK